MGDDDAPRVLPDDGINSVIRISVHDAATNCMRDGAVATLTLKSGVQFEGKLKKPSSAFEKTAHIEIGEGWTTVDMAELAAVGVQPAPRHTRF